MLVDSENISFFTFNYEVSFRSILRYIICSDTDVVSCIGRFNILQAQNGGFFSVENLDPGALPEQNAILRPRERDIRSLGNRACESC